MIQTTKKLALPLLVLLMWLYFSGHKSEVNTKQSLQDKVKDLYIKLQNEQVQENQDFNLNPLRMQKQKGLYDSEILFNIIDSKNSLVAEILRSTIGVYDNNSFTTSFVLFGLLEASQLGFVDIDRDSFRNAIDALLTFRDKNQQSPNVPVYNFWSQIEVSGVWTSYPLNFAMIPQIFELLPPWLQELAKKMGIDPTEMDKGFQIPPDNDDVGVNLALGSFLRVLKDKFPEENEKWESWNNNYKELYKIVKKYAYRPLYSLHPSETGTDASDTIDPRSYYYLQDFISQNKNENIILFSTWITNQDDEIKDLIEQPYHINNIDLAVNSNSLFGLNSLLLTLKKEEADDLFKNDEELKVLHRSVTKLIAYGIENGVVVERPDLALPYYPSQYAFYWFVSRNVHLLRSYKKAHQDTLPYAELDFALKTLDSALRNQGLEQILSQAQKNCEDTEVYWEGFLGNTENKQRHEDRLFSTAITINALLDTFTITSADRKSRSWIDNTPQIVKDTVSKAIKFILRESENEHASHSNAVFSSDTKGPSTYPYFYPSNNDYHKDTGAAVDPQTATTADITDDLVISLKGFISKEQYDKYLKSTWFGNPTPQTFVEYNQTGYPFTFWSSKSLTYNFLITALAKYGSTL